MIICFDIINAVYDEEQSAFHFATLRDRCIPIYQQYKDDCPLYGRNCKKIGSKSRNNLDFQ